MVYKKCKRSEIGRRCSETWTVAVRKWSHFTYRRIQVYNCRCSNYCNNIHLPWHRVFANAESLFYHVQHTRSKNKFLSQDEILNLLEDAYSQDNELERNVLVNADDQLLQQHKSGSMKTFLENECGVKVDAVDGGEATNTREEWMIPEVRVLKFYHYFIKYILFKSEEEERKEEEGEKERENEIDADAPYTAPLEKIPSLHTLEKYKS